MDNKGTQNTVNRVKWLILGLVSVGTFMTTLDVSIVNVALPTLTDYFDTTIGISQWFVQAYIFVITILLLPFGRLGDHVGRRRIYSYGILIFVAGSIVCGASITEYMLIFARALQAIGSAIIMSAGPALVTEAFPHTERGKALGFIGTAVALGLLAGPVTGGLLVSYAGWRWMFFINIPIGLVLAYLICRRVQGFDHRTHEKIDIPGALLLAASITSFMFGISFGGKLGWTSITTISLLVFTVLSAIIFIRLEMRTPKPLFHPELFKNREFAIGAMTGWTNYVAVMPVSVFMPFYLENLLRYKPDQVGLILASGPLTLAFVAPFAGTMSDKIGSRFLTSIGLVIAGLGLVSMQSLSPTSTWLDVVWRMVIVSFGSALFVSPNSSSVMGSVEPKQLGIASGVVALVRNLGMVSGIALAGAIIHSVKSDFFVTGELAANPAVPHLAFLAGLKAAFKVLAVVCFAGAFMSAMRVREGDEEKFERMG